MDNSVFSYLFRPKIRALDTLDISIIVLRHEIVGEGGNRQVERGKMAGCSKRISSGECLKVLLISAFTATQKDEK